MSFYHDVEIKREDIQWITHGMILHYLLNGFPMEGFYINDRWVPHKVYEMMYTSGTYSIIGTHYFPGMIYHNFVVPFSYEIHHVILSP